MKPLHFTNLKIIMLLLLLSMILYFLYFIEISLFLNGSNKHIYFHYVNRTKTILSIYPIDISCNDTFDNKMWFFKNGVVHPERADYDGKQGRDNARLFPDKQETNDRIVDQLNYIPSNYDPKKSPIKTVLLINGLGSWGEVEKGRKLFEDCPVSSCAISGDQSLTATADAILFKSYASVKPPRPLNQIWIIYLLESPFHTRSKWDSQIYNWTATYRRDSDLVAPYEKWVYYNENCRQKSQNGVNFAANKTKKVAWFVSNCKTKNRRYNYALELQKYIEVDIYGICGSSKCSKLNKKECFEMLEKEYKFYLSFENSNCQDYITEKFFVNALSHNIVPIVMGARPEEYSRSAPLQSYIHVDDFNSPKDLAEYLHFLDQNDTFYNAYFRWRGTGEFINTRFWCRLCTLLHSNNIVRKSYMDIKTWWRGNNVCTENWNWN